MWKFKLISLLLIVIGVQSQNEPTVNTKFGKVMGKFGATSNGKILHSYLGIPYAKPPINELRFKNPEKWTENFTTTKFDSNKPSCIQIDYQGAITGEEDCLYMNIFLYPTIVDTSKNATNTTKKLPVLVFIRGGSFNMGTTDSNIFSPEYLLNEEIVLVTFNYRLNALGFFSTGNSESPGNYGLKDMVTVLKWVKENIANFGGDPESVTVFGNSAGAAAIHHLALSPKTKGLFHKMITMSGSALAPWAYHSRKNITDDSITLARKAGCFNVKGKPFNATADTNVTSYEEDNMSDKDRVNCLRKIDARTILNLTRTFAVWKHSPNCIFGPTLEEDKEGAVITINPRKVIEDGSFQHIPWIIGVTADEGLGLGFDMEKSSPDTIQNFTKFAPYVLEYQQVVQKSDFFIQSIINQYFQGNITANFKTNVTQLLGDAAIYWPVYEALQKQLKTMKSDIYFYHFAYHGTFSVTMLSGENKTQGVAHMDDLNYLFPFLNKQLTNKNNSAKDKTMVNIMTELWSNFAKTGKPSAQFTEEWKPYQENHKFMRLGNGNLSKISMEDDFLDKRMPFWESLMKNVSYPTNENTAGGGASFINSSKFILVSYSLVILIANYF